jgi:hypothetical protein
MLSIKAFSSNVLIAILLMVSCHYGFADSTQVSPRTAYPHACVTSLTAAAYPAGTCNNTSFCLSQTSVVLTAMNAIDDPYGGSLCPGWYQAYFLGCSAYSGGDCGGSSCGHSMVVYARDISTGVNTQMSSLAFWQGNTDLSSTNENPNQTVEFNMVGTTFTFYTNQYDNFYFYTWLESDGVMQYCTMSVYQIAALGEP